MPQPLTLFEHGAKAFPWTERDWTLVDRLNTTVGTEALRLGMRQKEKRIQATQQVGVVRLGNRTIQILPKIYAAELSDEKKQVKQATANLLRMLAYAGEFEVREYELASLLRQTDDWFEILTRLFASHLSEEWRCGAYRTYQEVQDDLPVLKGRWRVADQLRQPTRRHLFSVEYDEFTADNKLNRVFRYVVELLWRLTRDHDNRQLLGQLRQWMDEVTLLPRVTSAEANPAQLTRLNERYRPLLHLASLFLEGGTLQLAASDHSTFAFVFNMDQLFESFVAAFIRRHSSEILPEDLQACEILLQSRGESRHLATRQDKNVFRTKPDIVFRLGKQIPILLDTKYKKLDPVDRRLGIAQSDFYQMHAYAHRYDCSNIILLYPQTIDSGPPINESFKLEGCERFIRTATVNLQLNLARTEERRLLVEQLRLVFTKGTS